ncbi:hypothetical protein [Flavobacterium endoglycinae]|uniref:hypothetical protein n=1 Tax=Flavobacterium endoglycinae TaxID=2816357 RepID=UPI001EEFA2FA|nr:hypothetical protein [Flavobacterium endoglycinae]
MKTIKQFLLISISVIIIGCTKSKTFILNDSGKNRYYVSKFINDIFEENQIGKSPLIVIDGIPFKYDKIKDTILLPLKKSDINSLNFLNQNSSRIIYNEKENDGAILITTRIKN